MSTEIRVRGRVQGVGFRPAVWRLARELSLSGEVLNDGEGVLIRIDADAATADRLVERLHDEAPPLARIDRTESRPLGTRIAPGFRIVESRAGTPRTEIAADAATCPDCAAEILDPYQRRYRYAFATCTNCGPRFSIATGIPYDRAQTTMAGFPLCPACAGEYADPADRRFHAEATACYVCGPRPRLVRCDGAAMTFETFSMLDDPDAVCTLFQRGHIVAIKGIGGYQLACDATNPDTVARLRKAKHRETKPFALMARDLDMVRRYCELTDAEAAALTSPAAPIVLLRRAGEPAANPVAEAVAPGLATLGFMLPNTPLHILMLRRMRRPIVLTSGNLTGSPQITDDAEALAKLAGIAEFALTHNRPIATRLDDSVMREIGGTIRTLRRGRGFAPAPITLPQGFSGAPGLVAYGADLKNAFCLLKDGKAVLSHHIGDLDDPATHDDYRNSVTRYAALFDHSPTASVCDRHPEYRSARLARDGALPVIEVQHHHAHIAACLAENGRPLDAPPVLGIALDGLGWGDDGTVWGGEFLFADYRSSTRLGCLKPVAMPGGDAAAREPWRNLYAHLTAEMGWAELKMNFAELDLFRDLEARPRATLDAMIRTGTNAPKASSCGRLFDAVAAALGICRDRQGHEGEAAARLEAIVCETTLRDEDDDLGYPFAIPTLRGSNLPYIEPLAMWRALLGDLILDTPAPIIAARFHKGLARIVAAMAQKLAGDSRFDTVALSGGCFQSKILAEQLAARLTAAGFTVLTHSLVPPNDGGIALGQAAVAAARLMERS
jgi:hydrogenase maturation protein HypF